MTRFQPTTLSRYRRHVARVLRYSAVSLISTGLSLTVLGVLIGIINMPAGWANVISTTCGIGPSFELNRRWVWSKRGTRSMLGEVVPFCALTFAGLGLSTIAVHTVNTITLAGGWSREARTATVEAANVTAFGVVWIVQYVILDQLVFGHQRPVLHLAEGNDPGDRWSVTAAARVKLEPESLDLEPAGATAG